MGKNLIKRQNAFYQKYFDVGEEIGIQKICDYLACVLKDPRFMGKDTFGRKRMDKVFEGLRFYVDLYGVCFTDDKEADYMQEQLDSQQKEAWDDDFQPFFERYPYLKQISYRKHRKGWVD